MRDIGERRHIRHPERWIGKGLGEDEPGIGLLSLLRLRSTGEIEPGYISAERGEITV